MAPLTSSPPQIIKTKGELLGCLAVFLSRSHFFYGLISELEEIDISTLG